jgi:phosphohistidine phosphatase
MRHAKAEPFAETDHVRALTERGRRDAAAAGRHLATTGAVPEVALVSTATRAVATWEAVAEASGSTAQTWTDGALYTGSPDVVLESLRVIPEPTAVAILVGHNPTVSHLAHLLDDGAGDPQAVQQMLQGYPAAAMAVLEVDVEWNDLGPEVGRLVDFHVGRG